MSRSRNTKVNKYERRVSVFFVKKDMFITRLDRPWIDTPFWLQGFILKTDEELDALQRYCRSVYIDIRRGIEAEYYMEEDLELETTPYLEKQLAKKKHTIRYKNNTSLRIELPHARKVLESSSEKFRQIMENVKQKIDFEIEPVYELITPMIDSVIRNSDALILLSRLRSHQNLPHIRATNACIIAICFSRFMGLRLPEIRNLAAGALLLDIGKTRIPNSILYKTEKLSNLEYAHVYTHVEQGVNILKQDEKTPEDIINLVLSHHERSDGSGYPNGLKNERIPAFGRIAGVIDCYNAMCTIRPYNLPVTPYAALQELYNLKESYFQNEVIEKFLHCMGIYPDGSLVELKSGAVGLILAQNHSSRLNPQILLLLDSRKKPLSEFKILDLNKQTNSKNESPVTILRDLTHDAHEIKLQMIFDKIETVFDTFDLDPPINNPSTGVMNSFRLFIDDTLESLRQKFFPREE